MWDGYDIPYGRLDVCDCCHDDVPIRLLLFDGKQLLCPRCRSGESEKNTTNEQSGKMSSPKNGNVAQEFRAGA